MPHRDPRHMCRSDRLLVVGQPIRRGAPEAAHRRVQTADHRRQRLSPCRDHHPEPTPRQPSAPQIRLAAVHHRAVPPVPLRPHPRLHNPGPIHSPAPRPPVRPHRSDRSTHRPLRTLKPQWLQLVEHHIGADLPLRTIHPLFHLRQERVDQLGPLHLLRRRRELPGVTTNHIGRHRVMRTPRQLGGVPKRPRQVIRFQYFHDLLVRLHLFLPDG